MYSRTFACILRIAYTRTRGSADGMREPGRSSLVADGNTGKCGVFVCLRETVMGDTVGRVVAAPEAVSFQHVYRGTLAGNDAEMVKSFEP